MKMNPVCTGTLHKRVVISLLFAIDPGKQNNAARTQTHAGCLFL
jgi:hypothetical protein